ncbi:MAG TPA: nuclear transport factor 2 family protein [Polyangiales bacterium]|jgi:ketosteroid isomerase-like protein|nr:nuclear transport factor 2 family protein [Polyangiales bacterium]
MPTNPIAVVEGLYKALETGKSGEALSDFVTDDAEFIEHPNPVTPRGARRNPAELRESSKRGAQLLAWQHYEVRDAVEHGDTAIMRVTWTAEIAQTIGPFRAGQQLTAHLAQFVTCRDGRIARLETYDCYEPFAAAPQ